MYIESDVIPFGANEMIDIRIECNGYVYYVLYLCEQIHFIPTLCISCPLVTQEKHAASMLEGPVSMYCS